MANQNQPATSDSIRNELVEALQLDLVGPTNKYPFALPPYAAEQVCTSSFLELHRYILALEY